MMQLKEIESLVFDFKLDERSRERNKVWRRFYLCNFLKETQPEMTLQSIADFVGLNAHHEVNYALKRHEKLKRTKDYKRRTKPVVMALRYGLDCLGQNLSEEVFKAQTLDDLQVIKNKLKDNVL